MKKVKEFKKNKNGKVYTLDEIFTEKKDNSGKAKGILIFTGFLAIIIVAVSVGFFTGCSTDISGSVNSVYRNRQEWQDRFNAGPYVPNAEISNGVYDGLLAVKCSNCTFVGGKDGDVVFWKAVPYAEPPIGELRFARPVPAKDGDGFFEAVNFGKNSIQSYDRPADPDSAYETGEDCLTLSIYKNEKNKNPLSPVLAFVHDSPSDPLYDGRNFVYYNPDIILVVISYRGGVLGQIDLSLADGLEGVENCGPNNGLLDQVCALKWLQRNIALFGGDAANITISGESAGAAAVSALCIMDEAKGLFKKAVALSGGLNQCSGIEESRKLANAFVNDFGCRSMEDVRAIPENEIREWGKEGKYLLNCCVADGQVLPADPFEEWGNRVGKDLVIMQGALTNEFDYYRMVTGNDDLQEAICGRVGDIAKSGEGAAYDEYVRSLNDMGYLSDDEINHEAGSDYCFQMVNYCQAMLHAKSGGCEYIYAFDEGYDGDFAEYGAAHRADCYYLFGNFDGNKVSGTPKQVDFSRDFQRMVANFCRNGNPSIDGARWEPLNAGNPKCMFISSDRIAMSDFNSRRIGSYMNLLESNKKMRYRTGVNNL